MSAVTEAQSVLEPHAAPAASNHPGPPGPRVARDFTVLLGIALVIGLALGLGIMLLVLLLI